MDFSVWPTASNCSKKNTGALAQVTFVVCRERLRGKVLRAKLDRSMIHILLALLLRNATKVLIKLFCLPALFMLRHTSST